MVTLILPLHHYSLLFNLLLKAGADAAKNLTVAKQTMSFKDVTEEQSMFLRRGFLVLCRAAQRWLPWRFPCATMMSYCPASSLSAYPCFVFHQFSLSLLTARGLPYVITEPKRETMLYDTIHPKKIRSRYDFFSIAIVHFS